MARIPWFRVYYEARTDKKVATLTDAEHRVWFDLMCYAVEQSGRQMRLTGEDTEPDVLSVEVAGGDTELLNAAIAKLVRLKIIAVGDTFIVFIHGEERQYDKPSDMPDAVRERVAKSRDKGDVKRDVTPCIAIPPLEERRGEESREEQSEDLTPPPRYDTLPECFSKFPTLKIDGIPIAAFIPQSFERKFGMTSPAKYGAFCAAVKEGCLPACDGSKKQCVWCAEHIDYKIGAKSERLLLMAMRADREVVPPDARRR